jgi:mitochondrial fission protein ELM1
MKRILIISDGKPGHLNQSISFCKIKEISYDILEVKFKTKFSKILSYIYDKLSIYKTDIFKETKHINYEFYHAIVSTGSGTYYFNKVLSKKNKVKSIVLMLPKSYTYKDFDYIIAQEHDNPPILSNLIKIPLNLSFSKSKGLISKIEDKKSLGIIIGGNNDIFKMDYKLIKDELDLIFQKYENYLKYITTSRRTPKKIDELISTYDFDYKLIYSEEPSINPIPDFLDICEELFISIDSTSMLSEARANSKSKINIINLKSKKKNTKFHKLASIVKNIEEQVDFKKLLEKIDI